MTTIKNLMGSGTSAIAAQATATGIPSVGLTATGSTQGTALPLPTDFNVFTTVAASTGTILPATQNGYGAMGDDITIVNHGANPLTVYPPVGGNVANGATNAGFTVNATKTAFFVNVGANTWAASVSA